MSWPFYLSLIFVIYIAGVWASMQYSKQLGLKDPGKVVIDEVAGQLVATFTLNPTWPLMILSFFLFRHFDITKPPFIKKAESFSQGWGIMLDDIVAGIYTSIVINLYLIIK
jgi:phosphatidylglycerophosphatase A